MADGDGFEIARRALGSSVQRIDRSVYDLDADEVGRFDVIYLGTLLFICATRSRALERLRDVCDGTMIVVDGIDLRLSLRSPGTPLARLDARAGLGGGTRT